MKTAPCRHHCSSFPATKERRSRVRDRSLHVHVCPCRSTDSSPGRMRDRATGSATAGTACTSRGGGPRTTARPRGYPGQPRWVSNAPLMPTGIWSLQAIRPTTRHYELLRPLWGYGPDAPWSSRPRARGARVVGPGPCVENARLSRMNGYGSQCRTRATALRTIQMTTTMLWPTMYCGVPKNRAAASAARPKRSRPKGLWRSSTTAQS
jgi:hypothetical protein